VVRAGLAGRPTGSGPPDPPVPASSETLILSAQISPGEMALYRLRDWGEFKRKARECGARTVFYAVEDYPLGRPPISLRLLFTCGRDTYVFSDFARGDHMAQTGIPVRAQRGVPYVFYEDVRAFIQRELGPDVEVVDFTMTTFL